MFELLFKYPAAMYEKGTFLFVRPWPLWLLGVLALCAAAWAAWSASSAMRSWPRKWRVGVVMLMNWAVLASLLLLLWQPALSVASLKTGQNLVAVLVDTSRSMASADNGMSRINEAQNLLEGGLLKSVERRFAVRTYETRAGASRANRPLKLDAAQPVTDLSGALSAVADESATLPIGAIVLLSDGGDAAGAIDRETLARLRQLRIPVHTIGFGKEKPERDVEVVAVDAPARAVAGSGVTLAVKVRQAGFAGETTKLFVRDGGRVLASRDLTLGADHALSTESITLPPAKAGLLSLEVGVTPLPDEKNTANNMQTRLLESEDRKLRILYFEGEPRWELKFIRRASETDDRLALASILRTTQNKIYRQGVGGKQELEQGFPTTVEELFSYDGLILGSVEAGAFTPQQLAMIKAFADRRGGGVLMLGGRTALSEGGWQATEIADMLPVTLKDNRGTFRREPVRVELTARGLDHAITRLEDNPQANARRWQKLPPVGDYQETGEAKPGALVLAEIITPGRGRFPFLAIENYGRGRAGVLATGATWKWQMLQDSRDMSHETFWRQMLRWLAAESRGRVVSRVEEPVLRDRALVRLQAEVFDRNYNPSSEASVEARITAPSGDAQQVRLEADPQHPGRYAGEWRSPAPGSYAVQVVAKIGDEETGRDELAFLRQDGVTESFHPEQNRDLLERISEATGGRYWTPREASRLPEEIRFSEAALSVRETHDLWDAPAVFLLLLLLKGGEWLLRRRWGAI